MTKLLRKSIGLGVLAALCVLALQMCGPAPIEVVPVYDQEPVGPAPGPGGSGPEPPVEPITPEPDTETINDLLFQGQPGSWVRLSKFSGIIDPIGTGMADDIDADGLTNSQESTGNPWVADYPVISLVVDTPIQLGVEVLTQSGSSSTQITSTINSNNRYNRKSEGSEAYQQAELAERTVQYQKAMASSEQVAQSEEISSLSSNTTSNSSSSSTSNSASSTSAGSGSLTVPIEGVDITVSYHDYLNSAIGDTHTLGNGNISGEIWQSGNSSQYQAETSRSVSRDVFEDRPFKNHIQRGSSQVKSDFAQEERMRFRDEKRQAIESGSTIASNAGFVRASFTIYNDTINMPVRISKIRATLAFDTTDGRLIPVKNFSVRYPDGRDLVAEVYGRDNFGPFVIELKGLNRALVEEAIQKGHTPRIFITDYKLAHVTDSNYLAALSDDMQIDNLKAIEDYTKGRTALVKLFAPNMRLAYRIAALELNNQPEDICNLSTLPGDTLISPGTSLRRALERLQCSGLEVEWQHFVYDFTGTPLEPKVPRVYAYAPKRIGDHIIEYTCDHYLTGTGVQNEEVEACVIRVSGNENEAGHSAWTVFSSAKFFKKDRYLRVDPNNPGSPIRFFQGSAIDQCETSEALCGIPILEGYESLVWPGDVFDIAMIRNSDVFKHYFDTGSTPLETNRSFTISTAWDLSTVDPNGEGNYYYPNHNSLYLGAVTPGDKIELKFLLEQSLELNADFGPATTRPDGSEYRAFNYERLEKDELYTIEEALNFELSFGQTGDADDWEHLVLGTFEECGRSWDFASQTYTLCITIPDLPGATSGDPVSVFVRPALANVFRRSIWPVEIDRVKKFDGLAKSYHPPGVDTVYLHSTLGTLTVDDSVFINYIDNGDLTVEEIEVAAVTPGAYTGDLVVTLESATTIPLLRNARVYANGDPSNQPSLAIGTSTGFADANNANPLSNGLLLTDGLSQIPGDTMGYYSDCFDPLRYSPYTCHGLSELPADPVLNWLGLHSLGNSWSDASNFEMLDGSSLYPAVQVDDKAYGAYLKQQLLRTDSNTSLGNVVVATGDSTALAGWTGGTAVGNTEVFVQAFDNQGRISGLPVQVNTTQTGLQDSIRLYTYDNKYLVAWESDIFENGKRQIMARTLEIVAGVITFTGAELRLSGVNGTEYHLNSLTGVSNRAVVVWSALTTNRKVSVSTIDLVSGAPVQLAESVQSGGDQWGPIASVANATEVLFAWTSDSDGTEDIFVQRLDVGTGLFVLPGPIKVNSTTTSLQRHPRIISHGDDALIIWRSNAGGDYIVEARFWDLISDSFDDVFAVSTTNNGHQHITVASPVFDNMVIIAWPTNPNATDENAYGRIIDFNSRAPVWLSDFQLNSKTDGVVSSVKVCGDEDGLALYWLAETPGGTINRVRSFDFLAGALGDAEADVFENENLDEVSADCQQTAKGLVFSTAFSDAGIIEQGWYRTYLPNTAQYLSESILIPHTHTLEQKPVLWSHGEQMSALWQYDNGSSQLELYRQFIEADSLLSGKGLPYGKNHFFVAPLLEHRFELRARILEDE